MANNPQFSGVQPPFVGSMDPPRNFVPPMPIQFRPVVPAQSQFIPAAAPHFPPVAQGVTLMNAGLPPHPPQSQFSQSMQHLPARPGPPSLGSLPSPAISLPNAPPNMLVASGSSLPPPNIQTPSNYMPGFVGPGAPSSSSYTFASSPYGQPQVPFNAATQYQTASQMHAPSIPVGQSNLSSLNKSTALITPMQNKEEQSSGALANVLVISAQPKPIEDLQTDWKEHISPNGRRYYYNRRTRVSSWEKPYELMTPIERADASTDWKEFTSPDGRKYYYNKVTKLSKWEIPEELKLAREQVEKTSAMETKSENLATSSGPASVPASVDKTESSADAKSFTDTTQGAPLSPIHVAPVAAGVNSESQFGAESSALPVEELSVISADDIDSTVNSVHIDQSSAEVTATVASTVTVSVNSSSNFSAQNISSSADESPPQKKEEDGKDEATGDKVEKTSLQEKAVNQEPLSYADKLEAKNAFKALLESANVGPDWTWEQALRVIITDRRYGALKTLGERKQTFNEFLAQKRKQEAEERRVKQKKAREEFKHMLEESIELTSNTRWSKAAAMFENDERFKAVERERERKDLFEVYIQELGETERAKAQEERKRYMMEYRQFLESCDFIKASTQWRKVQDRLEADERCSRLEKIDRLEIFQDYLHDLEKDEEEQRKIQKEEQRKAERRNRDEFRKLMEGHVVAGTLTARTHWRDYYMKVKDLSTYLAVASNTSGSTPKDLFEDVFEELEKQYHEDKTRIKDAVKLKRVALASTWTIEDFKASIVEDVSSPPISDVNLKLVFEELLERAREKEEKEAKKRKRLADEFLSLLRSFKEITASSKWENCKELFEDSREFSSISEESFCREIFDEYITQLKEQAKGNERKRKEEKAKKEKDREERDRRKAKHRREKERGHEREREDTEIGEEDDENTDSEIYACDDNKRSGSDNNKKHKKRTLNESEKDRYKSSHRHSSDHKRSKRHASTPESDSESKHKRYKRGDHYNSRRNDDQEELEDGEFGEEEFR